MRVELVLPELREYADGFPGHWINVIFMGNRAGTYQIHAITTTYVRLVEAAMAEYRLARSLVHKFWDHHGNTIPIGASNLASANFEACLTNMHRAVRCMVKLRGRPDVPQGLKDLIPERPRFTEARVAERIRNIRDAIQHLDEQVLDGTVPENTPFMLQANGPETMIADEPGQTLKTVDRLQIGSLELRFSDLCAWLLEMGRCAEQICKYERKP